MRRPIAPPARGELAIRAAHARALPAPVFFCELEIKMSVRKMCVCVCACFKHQTFKRNAQMLPSLFRGQIRRDGNDTVAVAPWIFARRDLPLRAADVANVAVRAGGGAGHKRLYHVPAQGREELNVATTAAAAVAVTTTGDGR